MIKLYISNCLNPVYKLLKLCVESSSVCKHMPPAMPISVSTGHTLSFVYKGYLANLQIDEKNLHKKMQV